MSSSPPSATSNQPVGSGASFSHLAGAMGDEGTFQLVEDSRPLRVSGFVSLICGVLSPLSYFGLAMILIPLAGLVAGLRAARRYGHQKPAGYTAGQIGAALCLCFGLMGVTIWMARRATLTAQAERYAMNYLDTLHVGQAEAALQLATPPGGRTTAPLKSYYQSNDDGRKAYGQLTTSRLYKNVRSIDGETRWKPSRPTKITRGYHGAEKAEVCLVDAENRIDLEAQIFLEVNRDADGKLQWHVAHTQPYRELIVSTGNL